MRALILGLLAALVMGELRRGRGDKEVWRTLDVAVADDDFLRGGQGRDTIRCGGGFDEVLGQRIDFIAADCEDVTIVD